MMMSKRLRKLFRWKKEDAIHAEMAAIMREIEEMAGVVDLIEDGEALLSHKLYDLFNLGVQMGRVQSGKKEPPTREANEAKSIRVKDENDALAKAAAEVCAEQNRKIAHSDECAAAIQPFVAAKLGVAMAGIPGIGKLKSALGVAKAQKKSG